MEGRAGRVCRRVIDETHAFYCEYHSELGDRGYEVLYGPPIERAPVFFLGFQPGGQHTTQDHAHAVPSRYWPEKSYYATEEWKLARELQAMFGSKFLTRCTGANAMFFRSPSMADFYSEVPGNVLVKCDQFCQAKLREMLDCLQPLAIVCIGFATMRRFGLTAPILANAKGRSLIEEGTVLGFPALATLHLSGARIASEDRRLIADFISAQIKRGIE